MCIHSAHAQSRTSYYTSLHDALVDFQVHWSVNLAYDASLVENRWTIWASPESADPEEDLAALLVGTGVVARRLESGTFSLMLAPTLRSTVVGTVIDAYTRLPLRQANVVILGTPLGVATDAEGRFEIPRVLAGHLLLRVSYVGYAAHTDTLILAPGTRKTVTVALVPNAIEFAAVEIWDTPIAMTPRLRKLNAVEGAMLTTVAGLGTVDAVRSIGRVPGVALDDKTANFHIQGGGQGDHQFVLDGSKVFEPVQQFGLIGSFNAFALDNIEVHKAGFGAPEGSYLSGVIHADHALTDTSGMPVDAYLDPLSFNARVNYSFTGRDDLSATVMAAFRTSVWDGWWSSIRSGSINQLLLDWNEPDIFLLRASMYPLKKLRPDLYKPVVDRLTHVPPPALPDIVFNDIHVAGELRFRDGSLNGSYYRGGNRLQGRHLIASILVDDESIPRPDTYDWINQAGQLTWFTEPSPGLSLTARIRGSSYRLNHKYAGLDRQNARVIPFGNRLFIDLAPAEDGNRIQELGIETVVEASHGGGTLAASLDYMLSDHRFIVRSIFPQGILHQRRTSSLALYLEETAAVSSALTLTAGARLTYLQARNEVYTEPRMSLRVVVPTGRWGTLSARLAGGIYHQFLNQFDVSTFSPSTLTSSTRIWLPVDESLAPPRSYHLTADLGIDFLDHWSLRTEGYYKPQPRVFRIDYPHLWQQDNEENVDQTAMDLRSQAEFVAPAKGIAYGVAVVMERQSEWLHVRARYEYNIAEREYAFRGNDVRMLAVPWSEPGRLHLSAEANFVRGVSASARWRSVWGRVWGFRQAYYDLLATDTKQGLTFDGVDFREPTSSQHQLRPLEQLDVGLAFETRVSGSVIQLRLDLLSALDHRNAAELYLTEASAEPATSQEDQDAPDLLVEEKRLLGRTLSVGLRFRW